MTENKKYLLDTNVIIHFPGALQHYKDISVHLRTVEELDKLKDDRNRDLAYRVRKGLKAISRNLDSLTILSRDYGEKEVDDTLLMCAKKEKLILVSNDLSLRLKCSFNKVECEEYTNGDDVYYSGVEYVYITPEEKIREYTYSPMMKENQFLVFKDKTKKITFTDGSVGHPSLYEFIKKDKSLVPVKEYFIKNKFYPKITPRNVEQKCFLHALNDDEIKILAVTGGWGVGKSLLSINYALQQLESGRKSRIIYVPNNCQTADTREVSAVPGDLFEKESLFMGTLIDILGYDEITRRLNDGSIDLMPISLARGRNIEDAIVIVNEAQNLTEAHVKLLIGRIGEGTKIIFDGDYQQADKVVFRNINGLKLLYKLKDSDYADLFCTVKLKNVERSRTAMVADYLDNID